MERIQNAPKAWQTVVVYSIVSERIHRALARLLLSASLSRTLKHAWYLSCLASLILEDALSLMKYQ